MKKLAALLLTLLLLFSLAACGSKEKSPEPAAPAATDKPAAANTPAAPAPAAKAPIIGSYKLTGYVEGGKEQDVSALEALGMTFYLVIEENGTGYMDTLGEKTNLKWDDKTFTDDDGVSTDYTYANDVITLTADEGTMTFTRLTADQLAYYQEHGSGLPEGEHFDGEGQLGDYYVTLVGAEAVSHDAGNPAIRVWYDFTNQSDEVVAPWLAVYMSVQQNGEDLNYAYLNDDVPESANSSFGVAPGYTARCTQLYAFDPDGGAITASVSELLGNSVTREFDPSALPGAPEYDGPAWEADPGMPAYMAGVAETGEGVEILGYDISKDWDDEDVVIVHFRFTNTGDDDNSFFSAFTTYAMQDGFGLESDMCEAFSDEQDAANEEIAPGESIECAAVYLLRTDDPLAVVLKNFSTEEYFGKTFELSFG